MNKEFDDIDLEVPKRYVWLLQAKHGGGGGSSVWALLLYYEDPQYISQFSTDLQSIDSQDNIVEDNISRIKDISAIDYDKIEDEQSIVKEFESFKTSAFKFSNDTSRCCKPSLRIFCLLHGSIYRTMAEW